MSHHHRIPSGEDVGAWFHESFLRGQPEQLKSIVRIKIKGSAMFQAKRDLDVPDFYRMPPLPIMKSECVSTVSAVKPMHCGLVAPCNLGVLPRQVSVDSAHVEQLKAQYTPNNSCHSVSLESADFESICHIVGSILPGDSASAPFNPMSAPKQKDESVLSTLITSRFPENEAREEGNYFRDVFSHFPVSDGDDDDVLAPLPMTSNGTMEHVNCDEFSMFIDRMIKDPL